MQLVLTEDQELLAKTAADFVAEKSPVARMRKLRDSDDPTGFSRELWKEMAELGWVGIPFEEVHGGADMGLAELAVVLEALGRTLAPEPFLSTVLLGGRALAAGGDDGQRAEWIPRIASGDAIVALAYQEARSRHDPHHVTTRASADGGTHRITGEKLQVLDGHVADLLIVSARTAGEADDAPMPPGLAPFAALEWAEKIAEGDDGALEGCCSSQRRIAGAVGGHQGCGRVSPRATPVRPRSVTPLIGRSSGVCDRRTPLTPQPQRTSRV